MTNDWWDVIGGDMHGAITMWQMDMSLPVNVRPLKFLLLMRLLLLLLLGLLGCIDDLVGYYCC